MAMYEADSAQHDAIERMAEIRALTQADGSNGVPQARVDLIEHERGWGQRCDESIYFLSYKAAQEWAQLYNETFNNEPTVPDWYVAAYVTRI